MTNLYTFEVKGKVTVKAESAQSAWVELTEVLSAFEFSTNVESLNDARFRVKDAKALSKEEY